MTHSHHHYTTTVRWTGNLGSGTSGYRGYSRDHVISIAGKPDIPGSSDSAFRGDASRYNPEEMLVAALSSCHMLWYLHLCADAGVVVVSYEDAATGIMVESADGSGQFTGVTLAPIVVVADAAMIETARQLHHKAHDMCFIARSVRFGVNVEGRIASE
jgi:organic hydroperoxide reductase OsmC/OhrA